MWLGQLKDFQLFQKLFSSQISRCFTFSKNISTFFLSHKFVNLIFYVFSLFFRNLFRRSVQLRHVLILRSWMLKRRARNIHTVFILEDVPMLIEEEINHPQERSGRLNTRSCWRDHTKVYHDVFTQGCVMQHMSLL